MNDRSNRTHRSLVVLAAGIVAAACGTTPPPPPSPGPPPAAPSPVGPGPDAAEAPPADPDLAPILQAFVDAPPLEMFFHVDELPARAPLRIARTDAVVGEPPLVKFGEPVVYQDKSELADLPHLEITSIERRERSARIHFVYDVEGVTGTAQVEPKPEGGFRAVRVEISER